jgi:hypothetical protein
VLVRKNLDVNDPVDLVNKFFNNKNIFSIN